MHGAKHRSVCSMYEVFRDVHESSVCDVLM